ncbi:hypothetical protein ACFYWO_20590 [Streptomyces sp. NPDC002932]|uniref:hypothetical protein n=1 Tax=Streptomyces sp. NPDC002932 TaxID=3364672 RepID=UPI00368F0C4C
MTRIRAPKTARPPKLTANSARITRSRTRSPGWKTTGATTTRLTQAETSAV